MVDHRTSVGEEETGGFIHAFNSTIERIEEGMYEMHSLNIVSDSESDNESIRSSEEQDELTISGTANNQPIVLETARNENINDRRHPDIPDTVFDHIEFNGEMEMLPTEDVEIQANTSQAQLLAWHYRLGHIPFAKIQQMASRGDLPIGLATCQIPKCAACMYGKATWRAWRTKTPVNAIV
jgi:GAG-pre-integrase domain